MSEPIEPSLFDFIDELADDASDGRIDWWDPIERNSASVLFCESFFDQFFAALGQKISGFSHKAKERAAVLALRLRSDDESSTGHTRKIITMYERFCDMYDDIASGYGNETAMTHEDFHMNYLSELVWHIEEWADSKGYSELAERVSNARATLDQTIG